MFGHLHRSRGGAGDLLCQRHCGVHFTAFCGDTIEDAHFVTALCGYPVIACKQQFLCLFGADHIRGKHGDNARPEAHFRFAEQCCFAGN